jgi:hypothetical protein
MTVIGSVSPFTLSEFSYGGAAGILWFCIVAACLRLVSWWLQKLGSWHTELHVGSSSITLDASDSGSITLLELLETRVPSLFKPFKPAWWLPGYVLELYLICC